MGVSVWERWQMGGVMGVCGVHVGELGAGGCMEAWFGQAYSLDRALARQSVIGVDTSHAWD
jgi:hypothetical protein